MRSLLHATGGCICGTVRYTLTAEPITCLACHCTDCQTITGAGYVLALRVPHGGVAVTRGEARPFPRTEEGGRRRIIHRCPECLTVLWSERPRSRDYVTIYGGTLDESPSLRPVAHIWTRDAQRWLALPADALLYEENPPDMAVIVEAWSRRVI